MSTKRQHSERIMVRWTELFHIQQSSRRGVDEGIFGFDDEKETKAHSNEENSSDESAEEVTTTLLESGRLANQPEASNRWLLLLLLISICLFFSSLIMYGIKYLRAPSDAACETKMWAFSKRSCSSPSHKLNSGRPYNGNHGL